MGCNSSRPIDESDSGFFSRSDTPSIYSRNARTTPSHSRNNSNDHSATRPILGSKFSHNTPEENIASIRFLLRRSNSHRYPRVASEKKCIACGQMRQRDKPCFGCLREKPKPRRHRSHRNAQVIIPRISVYGGKKRGLFRSNSIESPLPLEEQPPWVTARHGVFVPKRVANELSHSIVQHERRERHHFDWSNHYAQGGQVVSPEIYYSTLPLPDLPAEVRQRAEGNNTGRKAVWI